MKRKIFLLALFSALGPFDLILAGSSVVPSKEVYSVLFHHLATDPYRRTVYVAAETEKRWFEENPYNPESWKVRASELGAPLALIEALYKVNASSQPVEWDRDGLPGGTLPGEFARKSPKVMGDWCYVEQSKANVDVIVEGRSLRSFYTVSAIAFSPDRTQAVLKLSRHCAPMSGAGEFFVYFRRSDKGWKLSGSRSLWIS